MITYKKYKELATCKELFPYDYYTILRYKNNIGDVKEASKYLTHGNEEEFVKSIIKAGSYLGEDKFDMKKYC
jgi:hypothetical protein